MDLRRASFQICLAWLLACTAFVGEKASGIEDAEDLWGECDTKAVSVSPIELIADAEEFNGWEVEVTGVLYFGDHQDLLFASQERYALFDASSAFLVDLSELTERGVARQVLQDLSGQFVFVQGQFKAFPRSPVGANEVRIGPQTAGLIFGVRCIGVDYASRPLPNPEQNSSRQ